MPSHAVIRAVAGEAFLIPFVLYDSDLGINTLIQVKTPSAIGFDTIPNWFTARNTTPTNASLNLVRDPDLGALGAYTAGLKIFIFDSGSKEVLNTQIPTSPDALTLINYGQFVNNLPALDGQKAYMVITNDKGLFRDAAGNQGVDWREAARFTMLVDAFMIWDAGDALVDAYIPTLPMSDGDDLVLGSRPTMHNNVVFDSDGTIVDVSPLPTGMRTSRDNGVNNDYMLFDLFLSNRFAPSIHVVWLDDNIGQSLTGFVFNDKEESCSQGLPLGKELNVIWSSIPELQPGGEIVPPIGWVDSATEFCYPGGKFADPLSGNPITDLVNSDIYFPGFARFRINEYATNVPATFQPTSAGVAFSIHLQVDQLTSLDGPRGGDTADEVQPGTAVILPIETQLANQRGFYR
jgi:hypothetical protein